MTTILDLGSRALRRLGVIGAGQVVPGNDQDDVVTYWRETIDDLPGLRKGAWTEVLLDSSDAYEASDGERINVQGFTPTITLPTTYEDDAGDTVPQRDLSRVQIIGGDQAGLYVYSASTGAWAQADGLEINDDSPFGPEDDRGLVALLAVAMAPDWGEQATLSSVMVQLADRQMRSFRARFRRETSAGVDPAFLTMSDTGLGGILDFTT